jgi:hypothetical protein
VRRLVRAQVRLGVDLFKTSASGGAAGHKEELWWRNYTAEELAALVDEAHAVGKQVAVHSHTAEATRRALRTGVDTIEHGTELDEECLTLFLESGAFMVPTISIRSERAMRGRAAGQAPPEVALRSGRRPRRGLFDATASEAAPRPSGPQERRSAAMRPSRMTTRMRARSCSTRTSRSGSPSTLLTATRNAAAP